jgi:excisionase family DNA binding protein
MSNTEIIDKGAPVEPVRRRGRPAHTFEKHYTISAACELLSISRATIYNWIHDGVIPFVIKTPGGTRIPASSLNQFSESRRIDTCQSCFR